ncbi:MAG TPA: M24 family metallopeptidase [Aestuariivirgaceae bacterium]
MVPLPFDREEYKSRLNRVRQRMAQLGLELLIVTDVANQHYLTAYDGWSFYTPQIVIVSMTDDPYWVGRAMDAAGGRLTVWMESQHVVGFPEDYVQQLDRHPMEWIASWLAGKGWGNAHIGIETESYYYSPRAHARFVERLPNAKFSSADLMVNWLRAKKSPGEIEYMRRASRLVEQAMRAAYDTIAPGVRECDAVARLYAAQIAGEPDYAGDITALPPTILAGENASAPHILWGDRRFGDNETVALELAGACRRYHAGLARTMQLGDPPRAVQDTAKAVMEGMDAVLEATRPGSMAEEVHAAWNKVIGRYGLKKESRIGYAIGIGYPPDWGEHTISLRPGDRTVLERGHTLHCILGMWMENWGLEVSETILVTSKGAECLTEFPRDIFVK